MARSGSTLLGKELDRFENIGVTIEDNIPDGILSGNVFPISGKSELSEYLDKLYRDKKFLSWEIEKNQLYIELISKGFPLKLLDVYHSIYKLYFKHTDPQIVLHKKSLYYLNIQRVREALPDAKFIHILRDPRGTYNSQKHNKDSETGKFMSRDVVAFALNYKKMTKQVERNKDAGYFHVLKYEEFIQNMDYEVERLLNFLKPSSVKKQPETDYADKIPESQRHLHQNIHFSPMDKRIHAWRDELEHYEALVLQRCLKRDLVEYNYPVLNKYAVEFSERIYAEWLILKFKLKNTFSAYFPLLYATLKKMR